MRKNKKYDGRCYLPWTSWLIGKRGNTVKGVGAQSPRKSGRAPRALKKKPTLKYECILRQLTYAPGWRIRALQLVYLMLRSFDGCKFRASDCPGQNRVKWTKYPTTTLVAIASNNGVSEEIIFINAWETFTGFRRKFKMNRTIHFHHF